mmetsp:Transcript_30621/g.45010  ORF Transcript_30621/g.45010 Transcript_30621/m.45010 type:complete len:424 (-) Transcript_30621:490-1761(-)
MHSLTPTDDSSLITAYARAKQKYLKAKKQSTKKDEIGHADSIYKASPERILTPLMCDPQQNDFPQMDVEQPMIGTNSIQIPSHLKRILVEKGLKRLNLKPPNVTIDDFESSATIEHQITREIRISGLRKGRENALNDLMKELQSTRCASILVCKNAVDKWIQYADECVFTAVKQLDAADRLLSKTEQRAKHAAEMLDSTQEELESTKVDVCQARERLLKAEALAVERATEAEKNWVIKMEKDIDETKSKVSADFTTEMNEMRKSFESHIQHMKSDFEVMDGRNKEIKKELTRWKDEATDLKTKFDASIQHRDNEKKSYEDTCAKLKINLEKALQSLSASQKEVQEHNGKLKMAKKEHHADTEKQKQLRMRELEDVEDRVKQIITAKDRHIQDLIEKIKKYENRAKIAENLIANLHKGFYEKVA